MTRATTGTVTIEVVESRAQMRRFADVPWVLHHDDPRWSPGVRAFERRRLDTSSLDYFERGDGALFLARRSGLPIGRIAAHVPERAGDEARFGFFDAPDDDAIVDALVDRARSWCAERLGSAAPMVGPYGWAPEDEVGVLVAGHDLPAATGRPWHPEWYAAQLLRSGGSVVAEVPTHRIGTGAADANDPAPAEGRLDGSTEAPDRAALAVAGGYRDPRLELPEIAAVPDVAPALRSASIRSAWSLSRRVRGGALDAAVCLAWDRPPEEVVPELVARAGAVGYRSVLAPWSPSGGAPERVHATFVID